MRAARSLVARGACLAVVLLVGPAMAKEFGLKSPSGRRIYAPGETFAEVEPVQRRRIVAGAVVGLAPEGHLGATFGVLDVPFRGLDLYAGGGVELYPARVLTVSARYTFGLEGSHPYLGAGYIFRDLHGIGAYSHNAFLEAGYAIAVHQTLFVSLGVGVRRLIHFGVHDASPLIDGYADWAALNQQIDALSRYAPLVSLRVSRTF